jgi:hypothetical protein
MQTRSGVSSLDGSWSMEGEERRPRARAGLSESGTNQGRPAPRRSLASPRSPGAEASAAPRPAACIRPGEHASTTGTTAVVHVEQQHNAPSLRNRPRRRAGFRPPSSAGRPRASSPPQTGHPPVPAKPALGSSRPARKGGILGWRIEVRVRQHQGEKRLQRERLGRRTAAWPP